MECVQNPFSISGFIPMRLLILSILITFENVTPAFQKEMVASLHFLTVCAWLGHLSTCNTLNGRTLKQSMFESIS